MIETASPSRTRSRPPRPGRVDVGSGLRDLHPPQEVLAGELGRRCPTRTSGAKPTSCPRRAWVRVAGDELEAASGTPRASAAIWAMTVFEPWPMSCAPLKRTTVPSRARGRSRRSMDWAATCCRCRTTWPRCRRRAGRCAAVVAAAFAAPARFADPSAAAAPRGRRPVPRSRRGPGRSRWPNRPQRVRRRISRRSSPSWAATSSSRASWAMAACGTPNPRKAPGRRAVRVDRPGRARHRRRRHTARSRGRARGSRPSAPTRRRRRYRSRRGSGRRSGGRPRPRRAWPRSAPGAASSSRASTPVACRRTGPAVPAARPRSRRAAGATGPASRRTRRRRRWG